MKLVCDAMGATQPVECSYVKTIGTSYTAEVSEDMAISAGVSAEITVRNFHLCTVLGRAIKKCQRLLVKHWIVIAYAMSCYLLP